VRARARVCVEVQLLTSMNAIQYSVLKRAKHCDKNTWWSGGAERGTGGEHL
jgi:hypothetical protein